MRSSPQSSVRSLTTLRFISGGGLGVFFLDVDGDVQELVNITAPVPSHSDVPIYRRGRMARVQKGLWADRFAQYAAAVATALSRTHHVDQLYLYGDRDIDRRMINQLPTAVQKKTSMIPDTTGSSDMGHTDVIDDVVQALGQ